MADPFSILNVPLDADEATIERVWKAALLEAHPDRYIDAAPGVREAQEERTRLLNDAFAALMDPVRRADATIEYQQVHGAFHPHKPQHTVPPPHNGATQPPPPRPLSVEIPPIEPQPPTRHRLFGRRRARRDET
ncbi:MAG: DnaJ domain-containing protein [Microthrixaceae bacterium]|nr:DnaJ domain-containing protein [Microthrixaceae bacterium]